MTDPKLLVTELGINNSKSNFNEWGGNSLNGEIRIKVTAMGNFSKYLNADRTVNTNKLAHDIFFSEIELVFQPSNNPSKP